MRKRLTAGTGVVGALAALLLSSAAWASESRLDIARLSTDRVDLERVSALLGSAEDGSRKLVLEVGTARVADVRIEALRWECRLDRSLAAPRCAGPLRWRGGPPGNLRLLHDEGWQLRWTSQDRRVDGRLDASMQALRLAWQQIPLEWLGPLAGDALPEGLSITAGNLTGSAQGEVDGSQWSLGTRFDDVALDSTDGLTAAAGLRGELRLGLSLAPRSRAELALSFAAGELLHQQFYVPLAEGTRVELALDGSSAAWGLAGPLRLSDPEGMLLELRRAAATGWLLEANLPDLSRSGPRYLHGPLAALGFAEPAFAGGLQASLLIDDSGLQRFDLTAADLTFADARGVIVLSGLRGDLHWQAVGQAAASGIAWQALSLQGIALGPAQLEAEALDGSFRARSPMRFAPFGGRLTLFPLRFHPLQGWAEFDAEVEGLKLAALSAQLGWPEFEGTVSGSMPAASYRDEVLSSEGTLAIGVFDGQVRIAGLRWERPFGIAPGLSAEVSFDDLDLEPLTEAFGFGAITGRLDGQVRGLRMLDGSPVAFDAYLHTDDGWKGRRRISQKAVNDIGSVGGGVAAGLQQTVLSLFDTFGYKRIGLRCRLANNVCEMGGVEDLANGYVLIEGAGLPRVTVNGYRRRVDWPVLLARLQAAASGGGINVD